jgi:hypothetical protein
MIGRTGGTVSSPDGELSVVVPVDALEARTSVRISAVRAPPPAPPPLQLYTRVWRVTVVSAIRGRIAVLRRPVEIVFTHPAKAPAVICSWTGARWTRHVVSIDARSHRITARVTRLGVFAAFGPGRVGSSAARPRAALAVAAVLILATAIAHVLLRRRALRTPAG